MLCKVKGVVIKSIEYGDNDKLLTVFTHEKGKMTVCVKGAQSIKCKHMPSCELFSYSEFELYEKMGKYWVRESYLCESFFRVRRSLESMYLGQYICELTCEFALYDQQDERLLRLLLNTLYLLSGDSKDRRIIKGVYELKSASIEGFLPDIAGCTYCNKLTDTLYFNAIEGNIICSRCKKDLNSEHYDYENMALSPILLLDQSIFDAMVYIITAPIEKAFSFSLPDEELNDLSFVCEAYLLHQLERSFKTLDFYNSLIR